jgi:uncharacterized coiled-coil DUF342 family protein
MHTHRALHLTNDAVQKHNKNYGKFEAGNKLTYEELQQSINKKVLNTDAFRLLSQRASCAA